MATKDTLLNFITDNFQLDGEPIKKSSLDGYTKAELEEFIAKRDLQDKVDEYASKND